MTSISIIQHKVYVRLLLTLIRMMGLIELPAQNTSYYLWKCHLKQYYRNNVSVRTA